MRTRAEWRAWLERHHERPGSIWLVYPKKSMPSSGGADLDYAAIVEEALCFEWVDSVPRERDGSWTALDAVEALEPHARAPRPPAPRSRADRAPLVTRR